MKNILLLVMIMMAASCCFAQDTIIKTNGYKIPCRVLWVTSSKIRYKHLTDSMDRLALPTASVYMIKYANGEREYNKKLVKGADTAWQFKEMTLTERAKFDADEYYVRWHGPKAWAGWSSALTDPILGLIPTVLIASKEPKEKRMGYPSTAMMGNPEYVQAYKKEAHKKKRKEVWQGYLVGVYVYAGFLLARLI